MSSRQIQEPEATEVAGFISKTFQILNNQQFSKIAYWAPSGSQFIIKDINKFQTIVLPRYFRHSKMNSFIRQLNMYGFHKSRADHSKSVFSHPNFLRGREYTIPYSRELLILIRRKIKGKTEQKLEGYPQTPIKKRPEAEMNTTASKKIFETGQELESDPHFMEAQNNISFNLLGTKEKLNSLLNLNFTINRMPLAQLEEVDYADNDDDSASIAHKIDPEEQEKKDQRDTGHSFKFMNPSCFFDSMKKTV